jgi:hypothetical protein
VQYCIRGKKAEMGVTGVGRHCRFKRGGWAFWSAVNLSELCMNVTRPSYQATEAAGQSHV